MNDQFVAAYMAVCKDQPPDHNEIGARYFKAAWDARGAEIAALRSRLAVLTDTDSVRNFPSNTCSASRHADQIAERWRRGIAEEPEEYEHSADSVQATVRALWEARTEVEALKSDIEGYVTVNTELVTGLEEVREDAMRMQYLLGLATLSTAWFHWNGSPGHADEIRADVDDAMRTRRR